MEDFVKEEIEESGLFTESEKQFLIDNLKLVKKIFLLGAME